MRASNRRTGPEKPKTVKNREPIGLMTVVIAVRLLFPGPALFAFLLYSAFHFAGFWDDATPQLRCTGGVATIGAPALFWQTGVSDLFAFLAPAPAAGITAMCLAYTGVAALAFYIATLPAQPASRTRAAVEQAIIWIAVGCLSPLAHFLLYFCTLHSLRHFSDALQSVEDTRKALRVAAILAVVKVS
jgi:Brp/Blh family beta-carotene 15,15'-monooxygenase